MGNQSQVDHFPMEEEALGVIKGLTPDEIKDGVKLAGWNYGHIKYKVLADHLEWTTIYVEKECREKGYGTDIMRWIENEARRLEKDYVAVEAVTNGKDDILGRFLTKLNYKLIENFIWRKNI